MSLRPLFACASLLVLGMGTAVFACSSEPSAPVAPNASEAPTGDVMNAFPADKGDVEGAIQRAEQNLTRPPPVGHGKKDAGTDSGVVDSGIVDSGGVVDSGVVDSGDSGVPPTPPPQATALVLYDTTNSWGWLGELYAMNVASVAGRFGTSTAKPVAEYAAGDIDKYGATVYVGSTFDEQLPIAFLDDVLADTRPVMWLRDNIWQLVARAGGATTFAAGYGFSPWIYDYGDVARVDYKGTSLTRYLPNASGIMTYSGTTSAAVLAEAVFSSDGHRIPWAVRGKKLTYIGENPLTYVTSNDRYIAWADLLYDEFAPATPERHRALVRIEDVSPMEDPANLRAVADYLAGENVPFSVATIPRYVDPKGYYNNGRPEDVPLRNAPAVVDALRYMTTKGGTLVLHGYTHQYDSAKNPYSGVTADDFEFYTAHVDSQNYVVYDGPVPGDSKSWAAGRISSALAELAYVGLPAPVIFEFPHYAGSAADSLAVKDTFATVYHRGYYPGGFLRGTTLDYTHVIGVMYPYSGQDPFGLKVLPENMGSYEPEAYNNNPPRLVADMLATATANKVVRDGFASFYFHPYNPVSVLKQLVDGVRARGYTFVAVTDL